MSRRLLVDLTPGFQGDERRQDDLGDSLHLNLDAILVIAIGGVKKFGQ